MTLLASLKEQFNLYQAQADGGHAFTQMRTAAFETFEQLGFPTLKHEEWKYTNLKSITEQKFNLTCGPASEAISQLVKASLWYNLDADVLVFVNGTWIADLSRIENPKDGVLIGSLAVMRKEHEALFNAHFGKYAISNNDALNALNLALLSDGAFVYVPQGVQHSRPLVILNVADAVAEPVLMQPRNLIVVEKNAGVTLIEAYLSTGAHASFTNAVTETYAGESAQVEHYKVQNQTGESYQNNYTRVFQEANTNINHVTLTLDGTMVRNTLQFYMNGMFCNTLLYGLYVTDQKDFVDNHTRVDHAKPNCFSDEKYKGVLKDQSTAVFNGKILVHEDAQKTNAYQRNQNILLSDEATVNTKPQLEIWADDVKCTHGATIGQLDEEQMFYLRSRGITEDVARKMLLNAFADDIAGKIKIPALVEFLEEEIARKL